MDHYQNVVEALANDEGLSPREQLSASALLAIADAITELVKTVKPLVDTMTAQPESLKLRTQGPVPCLAGDPGSNGFRRCMEPYGHDGDHRHRDGLNAGVEYVWTQRHGDVP